ncbi:glycosyltransferase family 2 protein [Pseudothermotoga thermarum]|uniref:Glycosyl transferase family 2 n=1 Tax=Pseudothermotoga thermarum DSM 5069 TaxID=688269 RepID=F7YWU0_9THEM|nr:glycosyltransferase family 2 protein [Pseudothermotoga thermarum]AEH50340.1 glycosyl transferase family 2 [Pseudothermotoga thermarum DSM 5069]
MKPLVSIVVPVFNTEKYLKKCVDSLLNQTYKNIEVLLVNDGSTDNSGKICDEYALIDPRVRVFHIQNSGAGVARNVGIKNAKGEYITFVDSDDWVSEKYIETLLGLILKEDADISMCGYVKTSLEDVPNKRYKEKVYVYTNLEALRQIYWINFGGFLVVWNKLFKRSLFDDVEFPAMRLFEDNAIIPMLFYKANKVVVTTQKLYFYRIRPDSITRKKFDARAVSDIFRSFEIRAQFFKKINLNRMIGWNVFACLVTCFYVYFKANFEGKKILFKKMKFILDEAKQAKKNFFQR